MGGETETKRGTIQNETFGTNINNRYRNMGKPQRT